MAETPPWLTETLESCDSNLSIYTSPFKDEQGNCNLRVWQINRGQHFHLRYNDDTQFFVDRKGTEIWAIWPDNLTLEDTATYLLGPILGFVLRLRGTVCLHASAIAIEGKAIALVGRSEAGKSTTAAAFAQRGYSVLSEDVVALVDRTDGFLVEPAYPRIRLWDSSVRSLYGTPEHLPRIVPSHPTWDKRYLDLTQTGDRFQKEPLPLVGIYYLDLRSNNSDCPRIEPIPTQSQLMTLVSNTYTNYLLNKQQRAQEFEVLSRLVKQVPVRQIIPHADIDKLPHLLDTILEDFRTTVLPHALSSHA